MIRTLNFIAEGCLNDNPKIVASAFKFFLVLDYEWDNDSDDEGNTSDEDQVQKAILGKYKGTLSNPILIN